MAAPKLDSKVEKPDTAKPQPPTQPAGAVTKQNQQEPSDVESDAEESNSTGGRKPSGEAEGPRKGGGRRIVPVHQSRIKDRPPKEGEKDSSLKIKIELDLEVEVEIYARVKGDVTIGLM